MLYNFSLSLPLSFSHLSSCAPVAIHCAFHTNPLFRCMISLRAGSRWFYWPASHAEGYVHSWVSTGRPKTPSIPLKGQPAVASPGGLGPQWPPRPLRAVKALRPVAEQTLSNMHNDMSLYGQFSFCLFLCIFVCKRHNALLSSASLSDFKLHACLHF